MVKGTKLHEQLEPSYTRTNTPHLECTTKTTQSQTNPHGCGGAFGYRLGWINTSFTGRRSEVNGDKSVEVPNLRDHVGVSK